jgi:hypothetical protein
MTRWINLMIRYRYWVMGAVLAVTAGLMSQIGHLQIVVSSDNKDLEGFVDLLRKDASYRMPPWDLRYDGRDSIRSFFRTVWKSYGSFRTSANRQPAFAVYSRVQTEAIWKAHSIQALDLDDDAIVSLTKFVAPLGPRMFRSFAFPESLAPYDQPTVPH